MVGVSDKGNASSGIFVIIASIRIVRKWAKYRYSLWAALSTSKLPTGVCH